MTVGVDKPCLSAAADEIPSEWQCRISVFADTDTAIGGPAGPLPLLYRRAVVTITFAKRSQSVAVLK
jgi:hypothetical protein